MVYGPVASYLGELFPARIRYRAVFPYHIGAVSSKRYRALYRLPGAGQQQYLWRFDVSGRRDGGGWASSALVPANTRARPSTEGPSTKKRRNMSVQASFSRRHPGASIPTDSVAAANKAASLIRQAAEQGARVLVFPG